MQSRIVIGVGLLLVAGAVASCTTRQVDDVKSKFDGISYGGDSVVFSDKEVQVTGDLGSSNPNGPDSSPPGTKDGESASDANESGDGSIEDTGSPLCRPCKAHEDCQTAQSVGSCAFLGGPVAFCGVDCGDECPIGTECVDAALVDGTQAPLCAPKGGGPCDCAEQAQATEAACIATNAHGTCAGVATCGPAGLSDCDAPEPAQEQCDGVVDEDCDGKTDEQDAIGCQPYYHDGDADGFGAGAPGPCVCGPEGQFTAPVAGDCEDANPFVHPACEGKECGDDGCGGSCGDCPPGAACGPDGTCGICKPDCLAKQCGDDGCGGSCGACKPGDTCNQSGQCFCKPSCEGKGCGPDGCGGTCGVCDTNLWCDEWGKCVCLPNCLNKKCGDDGCGGSCGACPPLTTCQCGKCQGCTPTCSGKECGSDGCGGTCGTCPPGVECDLLGQCTCKQQCTGKECGPDGCGGQCGTCPSGEACDASGKCVCQPQCSGKDCGSDGCGGTCGTCKPTEECVGSQCKPCVPQCSGQECGPDGCGGQCGTCPAGKVCDAAGHCVGGGAGDECENPLVVGPLPFTHSGSTLDATSDYQFGNGKCPPESGGGGSGALDEVFLFSAPAAGEYVISLSGNFDTALYVVSSCANPGGTCIAGDQDSCVGCTEEVTITLGVGKQAFVIVDGASSGKAGSYTLVVDHAPCKPDCSGKACGDDGCGGSCGSCPSGHTCSASGTCTCVPDCSGKACGPDACGGTCGSCPGGKICTATGQCDDPPKTSCNGYCGDYDPNDPCQCDAGCFPAGDCCQDVCTFCKADFVSQCCTPSCAGKSCGDDGCGGSCGTCPSGQSCNAAGQCQCVPNCAGKACGGDGCGGSCGTCPSGQSCNAAGACTSETGGPGDTCADALQLSGPLPLTFQGSTEDALDQYGYDAGQCPPEEGGWGKGAPDEALVFVAPVAGTYKMTLTGSFDTNLYVVTNCANVNGTCLAGDEDICTGCVEELNVALKKGQSVFVIVDGYGGTQKGDYTLTVELVGGDGKVCSAPMIIGKLPYSFSGDTSDSTSDYEYSNGECPPESGGWGGDVKDEAFFLSAPESGNYRFTLTGAFDSNLYIVEDCGSIDSSCVAADEQVCTGCVEEVTVALSRGQGVFVIVDAWGGGQEGPYTLTVEWVGAAGHSCDAPLVLGAALPLTFAGDTSDSTSDYAYAAGQCPPEEGGWGANANDEALRFVAEKAGTYHITLTGTFDSNLYVVTDCANVAGTCMAGDEDICTGCVEDVSITLTAGQTVYIIVDGYGGSQAGSYTLTVEPPS